MSLLPPALWERPWASWPQAQSEGTVREALRHRPRGLRGASVCFPPGALPGSPWIPATLTVTNTCW